MAPRRALRSRARELPAPGVAPGLGASINVINKGPVDPRKALSACNAGLSGYT